MELPKDVIAADSDDEDNMDDEGDKDDGHTNNSDDNGDDDDGNLPRVSSVYMPSSPQATSPESDDETPDIAYAKFHAQKARGQNSRYSGWQSELRAWNKSFSRKHTSNMDLCKYWEVSRPFTF